MDALRYYQQDAVSATYDFLQKRTDNPCIVCPTGCHVAGHPILMYDGTVKAVEDVRVGDLLMGPDSQPRKVLQLCRGEDDLYQITPKKGEPFIVNGDHVLSLVCTNEGRTSRPCYRRGGEIEHVSVTEYLSKSASWKHLRKLYRTSVDFSYQRDLPFPPYILGLLLGDGSLCNGVQLTTMDDEIAESICNYADSIGYGVQIQENRPCPSYHIVGRKGQENGVTKILTQLGLAGACAGTKFIPFEYLTATRQDRLLLLAGLMDADGHLSRSGFDYVTKSKELASDVIFLSRSLGLAAYCRTKYAYCQTGGGGLYYRIHISGNCEDIPCRLSRKKSPKRKQKKNVLRTGLQVTHHGRGAYYGFTLDGDHLYVDGHFMVHHNSGKSHVVAQICHDVVCRWSGRALMLTHVKELVEQNAEKIKGLLGNQNVGIYSVGLKRRDTSQPIIGASIQSIYKRACEFDAFDLILVDEGHLIPPTGDGMYQQFFNDAKVINPKIRVVGLTATPYRMTSGMLCGPDNILNDVCYEIGVKELILQGFLCPLKSKAGKHKADTSRLHIRGGEFINSEIADLMDDDSLVRSACTEIITETQNRNSVLIFAASVGHARHIKERIQRATGQEVGLVTGNTPSGERTEIIKRFKGQNVKADLFGATKGPLKYLVNVNVLTTGFDAPNVDCVVLLRPTNSPGLYYQMVGRGFRLHPSKENCLVLDFGGNILRHGPVDSIQIKERSGRGSKGDNDSPAKECPECQALIHAGYSICPECGFEFPKAGQNHEATASTEGVLSGEITDEEFDVSGVSFNEHIKRNADENTKPTLRVEYRLGLGHYESEWLCFEHTGYARRKAEEWWKARSNEPVPDTVWQALDLANAGALADTNTITVRSISGQKYNRIIAYDIDPKPPLLDGSEEREDAFMPDYQYEYNENLPF